ncbi:DUF4064 domain-containing protein [Sporolactobacillus vineae]|uniref:DUF4064 domain-containing protein n=1 Tax=Sporolactobacillus vineae TaxID=444463 RepID=UPI000287A44C|nr:DUF4064 domain-containing protein [Sporolactobacillus vineae]
MKRTGEKALAIIGAVLNILAMISGIRILLIDSDALRVQLMAAETGKKLTDLEIGQVIQFVHFIGGALVTLSVIGILLAIAGLILLFLKRLPLLSGWLLIIAGIVSLPEIFPGVLYLIAGIMNLVRKAPAAEN